MAYLCYTFIRPTVVMYGSLEVSFHCLWRLILVLPIHFLVLPYTSGKVWPWQTSFLGAFVIQNQGEMFRHRWSGVWRLGLKRSFCWRVWRREEHERACVLWHSHMKGTGLYRLFWIKIPFPLTVFEKCQKRICCFWVAELFFFWYWSLSKNHEPWA